MLYEFKKGHKAAKATRNIKEIYGPNSLSNRKCQRWFQRFRSGNYCLKDEARSGRPPGIQEEELVTALQQNKDSSMTVRELARKLNSSHTTVHRHLKLLSGGAKILK